MAATSSDEAARGVAAWRLLLRSDAPAEHVWALISNPANSDAPPGVAASAAEVARDVASAELSGHGREAFPGYWTSTAAGPVQPCCPDARILAAGAGLAGVTGVLEALVVWQSTPGSTAQLSTVYLHVGLGGVLTPLHAWEMPGASAFLRRPGGGS